MSSSPDDLAAWAASDEAIRRLLLEATLPDPGGWVVCPGLIDGQPCRNHLVMCTSCRRAGCFAYGRDADCPNTLLDRTKTCVRCGEGAGMNRTVKLTSYALAKVWKTLHGGT